MNPTTHMTDRPMLSAIYATGEEVGSASDRVLALSFHIIRCERQAMAERTNTGSHVFLKRVLRLEQYKSYAARKQAFVLLILYKSVSMSCRCLWVCGHAAPELGAGDGCGDGHVETVGRLASFWIVGNEQFVGDELSDGGRYAVSLVAHHNDALG